MSQNISSSFFSICGPLKINYKKEDAEATLFLNKWIFSNGHLPLVIMLEGINQFACTLAMEIYPDDKSEFYVPNIIESFNTDLDNSSSSLTISGWAEEINGICRVKCKVYDKYRKRYVANVVLLANKSHSYDSKQSVGTYDHVVKLWEFKSPVYNSKGYDVFTFAFNSKHPLFMEHFSGHPVVPGSMLFEVVFDVIKDKFQKGMCLSFKKVKFIGAVIPGVVYELNIKQASNDIIFVFSKDTKRYSAGTLRLENDEFAFQN